MTVRAIVVQPEHKNQTKIKKTKFYFGKHFSKTLIYLDFRVFTQF
jgi:hypothetical protein